MHKRLPILLLALIMPLAASAAEPGPDETLEIFENGTAVVAKTDTIGGADGQELYLCEDQWSNIFITCDGTRKAMASHVSRNKQTRSQQPR